MSGTSTTASGADREADFSNTRVIDVTSAKRDPSARRAGARYHGDQAVEAGMLDFAVNVRPGGPPDWLVQRLAGRLRDLGQYPTADDHDAAVGAVAARHGVHADNVLLVAG